jgi:hypothetical protein
MCVRAWPRLSAPMGEGMQGCHRREHAPSGNSAPADGRGCRADRLHPPSRRSQSHATPSAPRRCSNDAAVPQPAAARSFQAVPRLAQTGRLPRQGRAYAAAGAALACRARGMALRAAPLPGAR